MKNKILFILMIFFFIFAIDVKADEQLINFSCDYQFEGIKFRVKVMDLEQKYVKDSQNISKAPTSFINNHVFMYYEGKDGNFVLDKTSACIDQYKGYENVNIRVCLFYGANTNKQTEKKKFLIDATKNATINCPQLYYHYSEMPYNGYEVQAYSTHKEYHDYDTEYDEVNNSEVTFLSKNCYKNGTDTTPIKCEEVDTGELYDENKLECVYSANNGTDQFKLIYDSKQDKLFFDGIGKSYPWNVNVFKQDGDNTLVIEDTIQSKFKNSKTCPKFIDCSCSSWNGCYFFDDNHTNAKCGKLQSENGDEDKGVNGSTNGDSPSTPDGWQISDEDMTCEELLGSNLTKIVNVGITVIRVVGALAMIIFGITAYIPAVSGDNPELLKKANSKAIKMGIILILIILLPSLVKIIGNIFDFDLSCLM